MGSEMCIRDSYRSGDEFRASAQGRSNQNAMFIDSTGRVYSLLANLLPSARGQGEPLSGRFNPPDGSEFCGTIIGKPEDHWLLASDAGYGFRVKLSDLFSRNKAGKLVLRIPDGGRPIIPSPIMNDANYIVAVSSIGKLLIFGNVIEVSLSALVSPVQASLMHSPQILLFGGVTAV